MLETKQRIKRYWVRNLRTDEELVLDADNLKEISQRLDWDRKIIQICKVWYRIGPKSPLIMPR
jgi:hypothetical protein